MLTKNTKFLIVFSLFFTFCWGFITIDQNSTTEQVEKQLIGKWKLIHLLEGNNEVVLDEISECKKRDYIEYKKLIKITVSYRAYRCLKEIRENTFTIRRERNYVLTYRNPYSKEEIITLNDSILKYKTTDMDGKYYPKGITYTYKKFK
jgi:hypothetical protein